jgi:AmiR/NasT family two-component response regulator
MESRATIEQAKGILIAQSHVSPDEAFQLLVRASQRENRKLREIAAEIVDRAQKPKQ